MTVDLDPRCATSQIEDSFKISVPGIEQPVLTFNSQSLPQTRILLVPGNVITFSMEAASNYLGNNIAFGFELQQSIFSTVFSATTP